MDAKNYWSGKTLLNIHMTFISNHIVHLNTLRDIGETDTLMNFDAVPQTLGSWDSKPYTADDEESILNHTITGLLLSGIHAKSQDSFLPEQKHVQKRLERFDENMDSASIIEEGQSQLTHDHHNTVHTLFVPTKKLDRPAADEIFRENRCVLL